MFELGIRYCACSPTAH